MFITLHLSSHKTGTIIINIANFWKIKVEDIKTNLSYIWNRYLAAPCILESFLSTFVHAITTLNILHSFFSTLTFYKIYICKRKIYCSSSIFSATTKCWTNKCSFLSKQFSWWVDAFINSSLSVSSSECCKH